jgi:hypothetical protein
MPRWTATRIEDVPTARGEADDPTWHPIQHYFGLTAFGANVFVARDDGQTLVEEHDEATSRQEELYLVLEGDALFELDGERVAAPRGTALAVTDPAVRRSAVARSCGTALLVVGVRPGAFETTWRETHFAEVPRA